MQILTDIEVEQESLIYFNKLNWTDDWFDYVLLTFDRYFQAYDQVLPKVQIIPSKFKYTVSCGV